ncbi:hypothetical protein [Loktanella sp. SALINAS62]|uniref:hypothetical protein n=1 Tax=Loktanella sp. SALINAS62 TaxID=2706124 RepID=UPI001B8BD6BF|nr:hypothetical protein [Loktanella sp. SALINAS62]MBS1302552.1 hypothetical protein [Loktanella sp. SALINAS62]
MDGDSPFDAHTDLKRMFDAARMATLRHYPFSPEAKALIDGLASRTEDFEMANGLRKRRRRAKDRETFCTALGAFLADLLSHAYHEEAGGFMYRSSDSGSFDSTYMTEDHFDRLRTAWPQMGLVESHRGFQKKGRHFGGAVTVDFAKAARYRATSELLDLVGSFAEITTDTFNDHFRPNRELSYPVVLKARRVGRDEARRMPLNKSDPVVQDLVADVRRYNEFLLEHEFNLGLLPDLSRTFHNGDDPDYAFDQGGRLADHAPISLTSIKKAKRYGVTIDGEPTCELDIQACHLTLIYGVTGMHMDQTKDPYEIPGLTRWVVKKLVNMAIGKGDNPTRWPRAFRKELANDGQLPLPKSLTCRIAWGRVLRVHPILGELKARGIDWASLQYDESRMLMGTLLELMDVHGVVALPVHDCIIVQVSQKDLGVEVFERNFKSVCGLTPIVTFKGSEAQGLA